MDMNEKTPLITTNRRSSGNAISRQDAQSEGDHTSERCHVYRSSISESSSSEENGQGVHCHRNSHSSRSRIDKVARRKLLVASVLCLTFMIAEVVGGILANSLAIATDAAHLMTDFASFMISLFSLVMAARPATKRMSFGWYRAEVMGALLSVLLIWVVTGILFYMAIQRVISGQYELDAKVMLITAGVGVAFNLIMGVTLHDSSHMHSHGGHSHGGHSLGGHSHSGQSNSHNSNHSDTSDNHVAKNSVHQTVSYSSGNNTRHIEESDHDKNVQIIHKHSSDGDTDVFDNDVTNVHSRAGENVKLKEGNAASRNHAANTDLLDSSSDESVTVVVEKTGAPDDKTSPECKDSGHESSERNINVRAAFIHVAGDMVQSLGVLVAAYIIYYKPEWKIADPICTFIFSFLVLFTTITILRDILVVLMEGAPRGISFNEVKECLCSIEGVRELHNLRLWSLTVNKTAMSVHLALDSTANAQQVLSVAGRMMHDKFGVYECTVQIENYVNEMNDCVQCQDPSD